MDKFSILLVDDEERIINFLRAKLKLSGYDILIATNGAEALEQFKTHQPDLVILDLVMPKMDGFDVLKELRTFSSVPVIILSAKRADVDKIKGLHLGADDYLPKPFNPDANEKDADPVLKEGNLLCNVFNKAVRNCFYNVQKYYNSKIPIGEISNDIKNESDLTILNFEKHMFTHEFHIAMSVIDNYIRNINKYWDKKMQPVQGVIDEKIRTQTLIDVFHMVRVAAVLMHPIAPVGTNMILEYLNLDEKFWDWEKIFDPIYSFMENQDKHVVKTLEPRVDFFKKHPSQINYSKTNTHN